MYMLFRKNHQYTDEDGKPCSLASHLRYLAKWGGTADCWAVESDLGEALDLARSQPDAIIIVPEHSYKPILFVNCDAP